MLFGAEKQCLKSGSQNSGLQGKSLKLMSYFTIITRDQIAKICWIIEKARREICKHIKKFREPKKRKTWQSEGKVLPL